MIMEYHHNNYNQIYPQQLDWVSRKAKFKIPRATANLKLIPTQEQLPSGSHDISPIIPSSSATTSSTKGQKYSRECDVGYCHWFKLVLSELQASNHSHPSAKAQYQFRQLQQYPCTHLVTYPVTQLCRHLGKSLAN